MRITYLLTSSGFSGAENVVYYLIKNISAFTRVEIQLVLNEEIKKFYLDLAKKENVKVFSYGKHFFRRSNVALDMLSRLYSKIFPVQKPHLYIYKNSIINNIKEFSPEIIHVHMYKTIEIYQLIYPFLKNNSKAKTCYTWHSDTVNIHRKYILEEDIFHFYTAVSDHAKKQWLNYVSKPIYRIYNGVNIDKKKLQKNNFDLRKRTNHVVILFPAGQRVGRGYNYILRLNEYLQSNTNLNYKIRICGGEKLPDRENIEYLGRLDHDDYIKELAISDILLRPSKNDTFGISILEAVALGKKVVCSNLDVFKEIFGQSDNIEYVELDQRQINKTIENEIRSIDKHSANYNTICIDEDLLDKFSWKKISKNYLNIYENEKNPSL